MIYNVPPAIHTKALAIPSRIKCSAAAIPLIERFLKLLVASGKKPILRSDVEKALIGVRWA